MSKLTMGSNKSFGIVFFIFFLLVAIYPLINQKEIRIFPLVISITFLFLSFKYSKLLTPLNKLWFKFGLFLGRLISPLIMGLIFFFVVTPIGLIMKILRKDLLNLRFNKSPSYWIKKDKIKSKMKNQF